MSPPVTTWTRTDSCSSLMVQHRAGEHQDRGREGRRGHRDGQLIHDEYRLGSQASTQTKAATTAVATVAIGGVSEPAAVHVVYNQGTPTSSTAAPAVLVHAALGSVSPTSTKSQAATSKAVVHGQGSTSHGVFRSKPTHLSRRRAPQVSVNKAHAAAVPQRAGVDGQGHQPRA